MSLPNSSAQEAVSRAKRADCRTRGRGGREPHQARHQAVGHPDARGLRKRHHRGDRTRRFDQRRAAPAGDRARRRVCRSNSTTSRASASACRCSPTCSPSGHYSMSELVRIGGIQPLMKIAARRGPAARRLPDRHRQDAGAEPRARARRIPQGQDMIRPLDEPDQEGEPSRRAVRQSRARKARWRRSPARKGSVFTGRARVFDGEEATLQAILDGTVVAGDVVVIRYEGPRGGPGMREMLSPTTAIMGKGLGDKVALITDGRFSGGSHGFVVGHVVAGSRARRPARARARRRLRSPSMRRIARMTLRRQQAGTGRATRGLATACAVRDARRAGEIRGTREQRIARRRHRPWSEGRARRLKPDRCANAIMHDCYCQRYGAWVKFAAADRLRLGVQRLAGTRIA